MLAKSFLETSNLLPNAGGLRKYFKLIGVAFVSRGEKEIFKKEADLAANDNNWQLISSCLGLWLYKV